MRAPIAHHLSRSLQRWLLLLANIALGGTAYAAEKVRHLGPTGIFGDVTTHEIAVTRVAKGSPADGKLQPGEAIVGAGGVAFNDNIRRAFADAIDQAESEAGRGVLTLTVKDPKQENSTRTVDLQLKVLGSYGLANPMDSAKASAIVTSAADHMVKSGGFGKLDIGMLGLLATGEQKYIDVVGTALHKSEWARPDVDLVSALERGEGGLVAWSWGYWTITLCEYYLLTGDKYVLPAIEKYALAIARGQDAAGLWGHRMAYFSLNGGAKHGRLPGYAAMNQTSLSLLISLILADKCGVKNPEVTQAIARTTRFYRRFIGKGALPYGNHAPFEHVINDNGKSGLAAVAFSLLGDADGARFFAALSAASYSGLESGHTGHYFNQLWTGLGANVAGPEVSNSFFAETRWLHTLNRTWEGGFTYDGEQGNTFSYSGLSDAGSHLLNYCVSRRKLYITGRGADQSIWLRGDPAREAVLAGASDFKSLTDQQLLDTLGSPLPWRRTQASRRIGERDTDWTEPLRKMLREGTLQRKLGACQAIGVLGPKAIALQGELAAMIADKTQPVAVRQEAVEALCAQGEPARKHFSLLLNLILEDNPDDPLRDLAQTVGMSLSKTLSPDPYALGLVKDKPHFYAAINSLLRHKHEWARGAGMSLIRNLPPEDFRYVADSLMYVVRDKDLTYVAYHNPTGTVGTGVGILARLNVGEGMDCLVDCLRSDTGKWGFKFRMFTSVLPQYGANAKPVLDKLAADPKFKPLFEKDDNDRWLQMVKAINDAPPGPRLITVEEARR